MRADQLYQAVVCKDAVCLCVQLSGAAAPCTAATFVLLTDKKAQHHGGHCGLVARTVWGYPQTGASPTHISVDRYPGCSIRTFHTMCSTEHQQADVVSGVCWVLVAVATGERKQDQQPDQQQQHDADDPYLRRPVPPPQHAQQDDPYFWSGSTTSAYYGPETAGGAAAAAGGLGSQHLPGNSSSDVGPSSAGGGIGGTASMDTSATTRVLPSQGHSEMVTTAGSGSACWGSALSRLKQLQLQTSEALGVQ